MPFQSEKQRKYLWANEPEIAREWTDKYGSRVKKANGGIGDLVQKYNPFTGVGAGLYGHFQNLGDIKANAPNQRDYNIEATRDLWSNLSNNIQNPVTRGIMDITSPALSLVTSPIYDAMQAGIRTVYDDRTGKFRGPLDNFDITQDQERGISFRGDGEYLMSIKRFIPDFLSQTGNTQVTLNLRDYPNSSQASSALGPFTIDSTTTKVDTRARARAVSLKVENTGTDQDWKIGTFRLDVQASGRR